MDSRIKLNRRVYTVEEIAEIVSPVAKRMGVERVYLFGPYADGCATPDSDVDILIDSGEIDDRFGMGRPYVELNQAPEKRLRIVPSDADPEFVDRIRSDSVLIYEGARPGAAGIRNPVLNGDGRRRSDRKPPARGRSNSHSRRFL